MFGCIVENERLGPVCVCAFSLWSKATSLLSVTTHLNKYLAGAADSSPERAEPRYVLASKNGLAIKSTCPHVVRASVCETFPHRNIWCLFALKETCEADLSVRRSVIINVFLKQ